VSRDDFIGARDGMTETKGWKGFVPKPVRGFLRGIEEKLPFEIRKRRPRPRWPGEDDRFGYQRLHVRFDIPPGSKVLDIGSGGHPFPPATVLADRFIEPSRHRVSGFVRHGKPLVVADVDRLPFRDKSFDFVYCSHLLEHVDNPIRACAEIVRVGRRGYIETPSICTDVLFAWAGGMHRWHIAAASTNLCFFEYSPRQIEGIRSPAWRDILSGKWYHPLQEAFYKNQDIFNVMFPWEGGFSVYVFRRDGEVAIAKVRG